MMTLNTQMLAASLSLITLCNLLSTRSNQYELLLAFISRKILPVFCRCAKHANLDWQLIYTHKLDHATFHLFLLFLPLLT